MIQTANMVEKHLEGILVYWDFGHANSGSYPPGEASLR